MRGCFKIEVKWNEKMKKCVNVRAFYFLVNIKAENSPTRLCDVIIIQIVVNFTQ